MVKHIVLWRLKDGVQGRTKDESAQLIKRALEGLRGEVRGLRRIEVGIDVSGSEHSADVALYSEFDTAADLVAYHEHPAHKAVMPLIMESRSERRVVDYETP